MKMMLLLLVFPLQNVLSAESRTVKLRKKAEMLQQKMIQHKEIEFRKIEITDKIVKDIARRLKGPNRKEMVKELRSIDPSQRKDLLQALRQELKVKHTEQYTPEAKNKPVQENEEEKIIDKEGDDSSISINYESVSGNFFHSKNVPKEKVDVKAYSEQKEDFLKKYMKGKEQAK